LTFKYISFVLHNYHPLSFFKNRSRRGGWKS
jgi:hypothetical protein